MDHHRRWPAQQVGKILLNSDKYNSPVIRTRDFPSISFSAALIAALLLGWHWRTTGSAKPQAVFFMLGFVVICLVYGHLFLSAVRGFFKNSAGSAFQFLIGFFIFNSALFFLTMLSPLGIFYNVVLLALAAAAALLALPRGSSPLTPTGAELPACMAIVVSGIAATLWCTEAQQGALLTANSSVFQVWQDAFFHVRQISSFAHAEGHRTIQDINQSGFPAQIYHYGSYISAAAAMMLTGASALDTYSAVQLPLGIFLVGLAAFSLATHCWGAWAGLAATVAIMLVPDAYQQGFGNRYLSYNFISQINLGMLYGIACISLAWIFTLEGCRRGELRLVGLGYLFLGLCLFYKAHIFVAASFPLFIYPALFFKQLKLRSRVVLVLAMSFLYFGAIYMSQKTGRVPTMRLDGSGIGWYVMQLLKDYDPGVLKDFFTQTFMVKKMSKAIEALYVVAMLLISTFGIWIAAFMVTIVATRKSQSTENIVFPLLTLLVYLLMSIGLALDTQGIGTQDELLNRPLVWAYFAIVVWTAGGSYYLCFGSSAPVGKLSRGLLLALLAIGLLSPAYFSRNLQTFPTRGFKNYQDFNAVPTCLLTSARYIRAHSKPHDLIQDSQGDPRFFLTALAERQRFAGASIFSKPNAELSKRFDALTQLENQDQPQEIVQQLQALGIGWYVLSSKTAVNWPAEVLSAAVFSCDDFKVFQTATLPAKLHRND